MKEFLGNLRVFVLGAIWAAIGGLSGMPGEILDDLTTYGDMPLDWAHIAKVAIGGVGTAVLLYWNRHKALLSLPQDIQQRLEAAERKVAIYQTAEIKRPAGAKE